MKTRTPWWRIFVVSLLVYCVLVGVTQFLTLGFGLGNGVLGPVLQVAWEGISVFIGGEAARFVLIVALATPSFAGGLWVYERLRRRVQRDDGFLHCLKCGYILKGLSEPRCPECGERI